MAGAAGIILALPAIGQQGPESLLPPGFGDPPAPPPATTRPPITDPTILFDPAAPRPVNENDTAPSAATDEEKDAEEEEEEEEVELVIRYDVPPAGRRSLSEVGIISEGSGGYPVAAFGITKGTFLKQVLERTDGPLASRWGTIMARRLLASRTTTPAGVDGADWTAERAWLLLRMGDSVVARQLVQAVDPGRYSKRLHEVAMQAFLANGDLAGMCPLTETGIRMTGDANVLVAERERARQIGLLPQQGDIHWDLTVAALVALGRLPHHGRWGAKAEDNQAVSNAMTLTDIAHLADRPVLQLSGGEQARVLLARVFE